MSTQQENQLPNVEDGRQSRSAPKVAHFTPEERVAQGKAARSEVPRRVQGEWEPQADRRDPVDILEEQAQTRVPELVPIRYGRMLVSPFTFYRGAAALMASDLSAAPRTGLTVQLCGDCHLSNFGAFAAPDRRLIFGINDFDETLPGPFEWDVKRLAASFAVAGRFRGFSAKERAAINLAVGRSYRESMSQFAAMRNLDIWYTRMDLEEVVRQFREAASAEQRARLDKGIARAQTKDSLKAFSKLTEVVDGQRRILSDPPQIVRLEDLVDPGQAQMTDEAFVLLIRNYRRTLAGDRRRLLERFRYVDAARKIVGVGSVGTRAWIVLMLGRDDEDPLFLQAKEAQTSVLEPYLPASGYANHGQRVVEGQRLMQAASDIMLGWIRTVGLDGVERDFYVRQLWDGKGSADPEVMVLSGMKFYARLCGWSLAKAHARSGDPIAISAYLGTSKVFDRAIADFAEAYADQNERDFVSLKEAVDSGRVTATTGV